MRKQSIKAFSLSAIILLSCTYGFSQDSADINLTGTWQLTSQTSKGPETGEISIMHKGDTAQAVTQTGNTLLFVSGDQVSWSSVKHTKVGSLRADYSGSIRNENIMMGTVRIPSSPLGDHEVEWVAARVSFEVSQEVIKNKKKKKRKKNDSSS
ncbi:MAG: hypothetical protein AAF388_22235 [Bacteroidota bacterium]